MKTKKLVGMVLVITVLGSAVSPAYAQRNKDYLIAGPVLFVVLLLGVGIVAGIIGKQVRADANESTTQKAEVSSDETQREKFLVGRDLTGNRPDGLGMRVESIGDRQSRGSMRFGLLCTQNTTSFTVACW